MEALFASIDESGRQGLRDKAMLAFLCETAARVDELSGCLACQLRLGSAPYVELHGKGGKARNVPVTDSFASLVRDYMAAFGVTAGDRPLFFNRYGRPLTQKGVAYVLDKRLAAAAESAPSIGRKHVTCHSMRLILDGREVHSRGEGRPHKVAEGQLLGRLRYAKPPDMKEARYLRARPATSHNLRLPIEPRL